MPSYKNIAATAAALVGFASALPQTALFGNATVSGVASASAGVALSSGAALASAGVALPSGVASASAGAVLASSAAAASAGVAAPSGSATGPVSGSVGAGPYNNGTTTGPVSAVNSTTPLTNVTAPADDSLFCPGLDLDIYIDRNGVSYLVQCGTNHFGIIIDIVISLAKRQALAAPQNLGDCMNICDATAGCVGTAFNTAASTCTLFSDVGASFDTVDTDFAILIAAAAPAASASSSTAAAAGTAGTVTVGAGAGAVGATGLSTIAAGQTATSTLYSTNVVTVQSCAPTVTDCPLRNPMNVVVTQLIPIQSTEYICPTASVVPVAPVACGCAYSVSTAQAYSATVQSGSTILVPVTSTVIAVPMPTATTYTTTICPASSTLATGPATGVASTGPATGVASTGPATGVATTGPAGGVPTAALVAVCPGCPSGVSTMTSAGGVPTAALVAVCPGCPSGVSTMSSAAAQTVSVCAGCPSGVATGTSAGQTGASATTSSGLLMFTGAASNVKAGMGMGAVVAAAALLL